VVFHVSEYKNPSNATKGIFGNLRDIAHVIGLQSKKHIATRKIWHLSQFIYLSEENLTG
jgi:hypothetical protein